MMLLLLFVAAAGRQLLVSGTTSTNVVSQEYDQLLRATKEMEKKDISLQGFYHTSSWAPYWQDILREQLYLLDGKRARGKWSNNPLNFTDMDITNMAQTKVSLLSQAKSLYLNVAGESSKDLDTIQSYVESLKLKHHTKIRFNFNTTAGRGAYSHAAEKKDTAKMKEMQDNPLISEGESSTIMALHSYCKKEVASGRKAFIFYMHSKGGCCVRGKKQVSYKVLPVASWREAMNTFNIEFPSICLRALLNGYSVCGMEYQDAHHSGNFWWANCEHISSLPPLENRFDAWKSEFFVYRVSRHGGVNHKFGQNCGYSTHKCIGVNHYDHECPRSTYRSRVLNYVSQYELPPNEVATVSTDSNWVKDTCGKLRQQPYESQPFWDNPSQFTLK